MDWLFEGLVQFLTSPIWKCHIEDFVDQNCLIFDAGEENKFTYTDVHHEYKAIVEKVLQTFFLQELNMSFSELMSACSDGFAKNKRFKELFKPLMAVDDFLLFKSIMVQRNIRLNEEAEKAFEKQQKTAKPHNGDQLLSKKREHKNKKEKPTEATSEDTQNDEELVRILIESKIEYERQLSQEEEEFARLVRQATDESLKSYEMEMKTQHYLNLPIADVKATPPEDPVLPAPTDALQSPDIGSTTQEDIDPPHSPMRAELEEDTVPPEPTEDSKATIPSVQSAITTGSHEEESSPTRTKPAIGVHVNTSGSKESTSQDSALLWLESAKAEAATSHESSQVSNIVTRSSDLKTREDYLKAKRDSIIAKKKKERESELQDYLKANPKYTASERVDTSSIEPLKEASDETSDPAELEYKKNDKSWRNKLSKKKPVLTPDVADKIK